MQQNFYIPKSRNKDAEKVTCFTAFTLFMSSVPVCTV